MGMWRFRDQVIVHNVFHLMELNKFDKKLKASTMKLITLIL